MNINKRKPLTNLEYAGMESLLDRLINAYEEYQGIPEYDRTPAKEVRRRTESGMGIFDSEYNCYQIEDFLVKCSFSIDDMLVMAGYRLTVREKEECFDPVPDAMIDVMEFLDKTYIDVDRLLEKVSQIDK